MKRKEEEIEEKEERVLLQQTAQQWTSTWSAHINFLSPLQDQTWMERWAADAAGT